MNVEIKSAKGMLQSKIPKSRFDLLGSPMHTLAVKAGETLLTPSHLAKTLSADMAVEMPRDLQLHGISANASVELVFGPVFVIKVTVREVDAGSILEKLGVAKVGSCIVKCLPSELVAKLQEELLAKAVAAKLGANMAADLQQHTAGHGIHLVATGVVPALEGAFLLKLFSKQKVTAVDEGSSTDRTTTNA